MVQPQFYILLELEESLMGKDHSMVGKDHTPQRVFPEPDVLLPPGTCLWGVHRAPGVSGPRHDLVWPISSESPTGRCCGPTKAEGIPASTKGPGELW